ncbi:MAG: NAD-dependent epimerase/dehydratase family protein [Actinomycetota bacterium]
MIDEGCRVRILDSDHPAAHDRIPDYLHPEAEFIEGDVADPATILRAVSGCDAVTHQAAMVGLGTSFGDVRDYVLANDLGTATLVWALHETGFTGRLVVAGSMVVYGEGMVRCATHGVIPATPRAERDLLAGRYEVLCSRCDGDTTWDAVDEDARLDPRNVYAATKLLQEHLCFALARERAIECVALRYHNVYGPRMPRNTPYAGVASIFRSAVAAGRGPRVLEDGKQTRDFVHVRDVAHANVLALLSPLSLSGPVAFNISSGTPRTVGEMAEAMCDAAGREAPRPEYPGGYRLGDVRHIVASASRAGEILGFKAQVPFSAGIAEFLRAPMRQPAASAHATLSST